MAWTFGVHKENRERQAQGFQFFWNFVFPQPITITAERRAIQTKQELPWHPGSYLFAGNPPQIGKDPRMDSFFIRREESFMGQRHPTSFVFPGTPPLAAPELAQGYILFN